MARSSQPDADRKSSAYTSLSNQREKHQIPLPLRTIVLLPLLALIGCEKWELDRRMAELCKHDGGVRVYEVVRLPPEMFDQNGDPFPGWRSRNPEDRLGPTYLYERTDAILKDGNPLKGEGRLRRSVERVIKRADRKVLGEAVSYGRSGGDFIVLDHFTSKRCPEGHSESELLRRAFIRG